MAFIHVKRRRPVIVKSTPAATTSVTSAPQQPTVIRAWRIPARMRPVVFVQGRANNAPPVDTGVLQPPVVGRIPFPRPLRPSRIVATKSQYVTNATTVVTPHLDWIRPLVVRGYPTQRSRQYPKPVVVKTRRGIPGQTESIVVRRPSSRIPVRKTVFLRTNPLFPPVRNWKQATTTVRRLIQRNPISIQFAHTPYVHAPNIDVPNEPLVVRIPRRVRGIRPILYSTETPVYHRPRPLVVTVPQNPPRRTLPRASRVTFTSPVGGKSRPIQPVVISARRRRAIQPPLIARSTSLVANSTNVWKPRLILPIVSVRHIARTAAKKTILASQTGITPGKIVRPAIITPRLTRSVRKANTITMATRVPTGHNPDPIGQGYWDIISASIAYLRALPSIVAAFGDAPANKINKFTSDDAPRETGYPYAVFYEPEEVESFETTDGTAISSLIAGVYRIEVFSNRKITARRLSETIADRLNDAPLVFTNGVLIYLRRSVRQYPTLEVPGTGPDVAVYKRMIEFEYQFERTYTL